MRAWILGFVFVTALLLMTSGCRGRSGGFSDDVVMVADDDKKMQAAIQEARSSADTFVKALGSPKASQSDFSVKLGVKDGEQVEHMWLSDVSYDGSSFHGVVNNDAELVRTVKLGDKVSVPKTEISDWMFVENGKLVGGYTLRVLRDQLSEKERREMDSSLPFKVE